MDEGKIPLTKDAEAISKLSKPPVSVKVGIYELNETGDELVKTGDVTAYLHRLTWLERNHIRASSTLAYRHWIDNGGDKESARDAVANVVPRFTIFFALRKGSEFNAERFFDSQEALMQYPFEQGIFDLYGAYLKEFNLSETEWGNFLRARNSETLSALPAISQAPIHSEASHQN